MSGTGDLIPVVVQDVRNNNVLMVAFTNNEALELTEKTGYMHYWSRSREQIWKKGETSGNVQKVVELLKDCDEDAILARVEQTGAACHNGTYSCFFDKPIGSNDIVAELFGIFEDRKQTQLETSYTYKLLRNRNLLLKKVAEESSEVILAAKDKRREEVIREAADLIYHLLVLLFDEGITIQDVYRELEERRK